MSQFDMTYCDFNSYLIITGLIQEESLGVCDHEITQIILISTQR